MNCFNYLVIALVCMEADALITMSRSERYNVLASFLLAVFWPITCPLTILAAIKANAKADRTEVRGSVEGLVDQTGETL